MKDYAKIKKLNKSFTISTLIILFTTGCGASRVASITQKESVRVEIAERIIEHHDTLVFDIPHIAEQVITLKDSSVLANDFARSEAIVLADGSLHHSLETIPQSVTEASVIQIEVRDSIIYRTREIVNTIEVESQLSKLQLFQIYGFWILLLLLATTWLIILWYSK